MKVAEGVPLSRIIARQLIESPEIVVRGASRSIAAEKFRRLKTLLENDPDGAAQVIVVTSSTPQEGKSLVALNLALAFASDRNTETLIVDADLRRPTQEKWVSPPPSLGLSDLLSGRADLEHTVMRFKDTTLEMLPAGHPPEDPVELLASDACRTIVAALRKRYRRVIIDTPPIVPFTDADVVARYADGVLLVVRSGRTPKLVFAQAASTVTSTRILGVVLNDVTANLADRGHHYGRYYHTYYNRDGEGKKP
ncbi:MAG: CpsD/CapB family tyrosine-protein kinase [Acidobacteriia bacterium]|nr:CpsD/CapB family tyrosine-protein kinase [Terriglobia bacterium]